MSNICRMNFVLLCCRCVADSIYYLEHEVVRQSINSSRVATIDKSED
jgi:hypothetical protein